MALAGVVAENPSAPTIGAAITGASQDLLTI